MRTQLGTDAQYVDAPWMKVAESYLGTHEIRGGENPVILRFFAEAGHPEIKDDETAWCSAFANAIMYESGRRGTRNLMAKSWLRWIGGTRVSEPRFGDLAIFTNGNPSSPHGHVAFFVEWDDDTVTVLGGNQGRIGEVSVAKETRGRLVGFMRPNSESVEKEFFTPSIPSMTDYEAASKDVQHAGTAGGVGVLAAAAWGNYQAAILLGAAAVLLVSIVWYARHKKAKAEVAEMQPQFKPSSRVAAAKKISEFVPPVPGSELVVEHRPKTRHKSVRKKSVH